jgi:hypothetical protein
MRIAKHLRRHVGQRGRVRPLASRAGAKPRSRSTRQLPPPARASSACLSTAHRSWPPSCSEGAASPPRRHGPGRSWPAPARKPMRCSTKPPPSGPVTCDGVCELHEAAWHKGRRHRRQLRKALSGGFLRLGRSGEHSLGTPLGNPCRSQHIRTYVQGAAKQATRRGLSGSAARPFTAAKLCWLAQSLATRASERGTSPRDRIHMLLRDLICALCMWLTATRGMPYACGTTSS